MTQTPNIHHKTSETGQVFVILALVMVVLLGFTALAIDGGLTMMTRKRAQNSADASAMAAAFAAMVGSSHRTVIKHLA